MSKVVLLLLSALVAGVAIADDAPPPAPALPAKAYVLIDHATGTVLADSAADQRLPPASLTKLMTSYLVFQALRDGRLALDDHVTVSEKAWRMRGSRMFIEVGSLVPVEDLIRGLIVQSGNDAAVALAEHVAGSVPAFVELMNREAAVLGMTNTSYRNTDGLPAKDHYSSASDQALLARAMIDEFPEYYGWYSEREFTWNNIKQLNRNRLLWRDASVDGLKTGYTSAAGYCLVTSAARDGMRLIAVVLGAETAGQRTAAAERLLGYGFEHYETHRLFTAGEELTAARVWRGAHEITPLGLLQDVVVTIPRGSFRALHASMTLPVRLMAPLSEHAEVGAVEISLAGRGLAVAPVVVLDAVAEGGPWTRLRDEVMLWLE